MTSYNFVQTHKRIRDSLQRHESKAQIRQESVYLFMKVMNSFGKLLLSTAATIAEKDVQNTKFVTILPKHVLEAAYELTLEDCIDWDNLNQIVEFQTEHLINEHFFKDDSNT